MADMHPTDILPPAPPSFGGEIKATYAESIPDWPPPTRPPLNAPNIVVILMDDLGFGQLSCYGGPIEAPNIAALAENGLRYTNFHTTALCSPTRAALLTGRNHHSVGFATIAEMATGFPGSNSFLPASAASIAEVLRQTGYSTYCAGKWHLTPTSESTAAGPFDRWPLGQGFERFYGFLPGEVDQWHPMVTVDNHRVPTPTEGRDGGAYHVSEDVVDNLIAMIRDQQQVASGRPFFAYLPFGASHCPFHAPEEFIEPYRGRFDHGWDVERARIFERQKALGIVPTDCELPERNPGIAQWDELDDDSKYLFARLHETYCGFVDHTDAQIGRLVDALRDLDVLDDTLVLFFSDNGASAEGGHRGTTNTERFRNLMNMSVAEMMEQVEDLGGPHTDPHYPMGWSMAGNTPFKRWKRDTHRGGNTDPMIVHWPARVEDPGAIRTQYHHVTDIFPTLLEVAGLPTPIRVNGVDQQPLEGVSFAATIADPAAPEVKETQYYEMLGSRAIYHDGWMAVTWHAPGTDWNDDPWELYHQVEDYSQAHDLASEQPEKLEELIDLWWREAEAHNVLPLDDRGRERFIDPQRPSASEDRDVYRYYPGTRPIPNPSLPRILNCEHALTAFITRHTAADDGLLVCQGGELAGWSLFVQGGRPHYVHNVLKMEMHELQGPTLPVGRECEVRVEYHPTEQGWGTATLLVDGVVVDSSDRFRITPMGYSMVQEGFCVGRSWGTPVAYEHYRGAFAFTGDIRVVELRTDPASQVWTPRPQWSKA
ncbi:MAG: arylsulfatase [Acidimicrobiales bacterium]